MYLVKLYKNSKILFIVIGLYVVGLLYYALRQREEFPFLLYGMYSMKEWPQPQYISYIISINGKELDYQMLPDSKRELIATPIYNIAASDKAAELKKLSAWLSTYLTNNGCSKSKLEITRITCSYGNDGRPIVLNKEPISTYETGE